MAFNMYVIIIINTFFTAIIKFSTIIIKFIIIIIMRFAFAVYCCNDGGGMLDIHLGVLFANCRC